MDILISSNLAYVLLVAGFMLAILAMFAPGTGFLELGALFILVVAGYLTTNLQINYWALGVLILGVFPFLFALRRSRQWIYLLISILALLVGSLFLFRQPNGLPAIDPALAVVVSILAGGITWYIGRRAVEAIAQHPALDLDELIGKIGDTRTPVDHQGSVYVDGEIWTAHSDASIPVGSKVRIKSRAGLVLEVEAVNNQPGSQS
ncbi:MAG: NfeD family protein [Anaerolineaceae bacterium]|nr:NfeD family protein [Anaerolineaceae bacterium]